MKIKVISGALLCAAVVALPACTVTPPHLAFREPSVTVWAPVAPPPPRAEVISVAPSREHVWIPGYWHWEGNQHRWHDGYWERRRENEHWVAHQWEKGDRGQWRLNGGYWQHN